MELPNIEVCEVYCSDEAKVARVRERTHEMSGLAELFKALADDTRLKIVYSLFLEELCVCDLANVLGVSPPAVSHHLRLLRSERLVKSRRAGKVVFYSLDDEHVARLLADALAHHAEPRQ